MPETIKNNRSTIMWDVVEDFYRCMADFMEQYEKYEERVAAFARARGLHRSDLRLRASEIATLIDKGRIGQIRDYMLFDLKESSHKLFRTPEGNDDFDRFVSELYHEISVLREEHYSIETYIPGYEEGPHKKIAETVLYEAYDLFPRKMNMVKELFEKAKGRLETVLPEWRHDSIFVRSLYLFGNDFLPKIYRPDGLEAVYRLMYPDFGIVEGYYEVALSFYRSGFYDRAAKALRLAKAKLKNGNEWEKDPAEMEKKIAHLQSQIKSAQENNRRKI